MATNSTFDNELEKFKKLFGYGSFRPMQNNRVEVRVKDLDNGLMQARKILSEHQLNLKIRAITPQLKSFEIVPNDNQEKTA